MKTALAYALAALLLAVGIAVVAWDRLFPRRPQAACFGDDDPSCFHPDWSEMR